MTALARILTGLVATGQKPGEITFSEWSWRYPKASRVIENKPNEFSNSSFMKPNGRGKKRTPLVAVV